MTVMSLALALILLTEARADQVADPASSIFPARPNLSHKLAPDPDLISGDEMIRLWRKPPEAKVAIPVAGKNKNLGPCGSTHYSPDLDRQGRALDTYADPRTACAFVAVLQEWKKSHCPGEEEGCNVFWGDIGHRNKTFFNGHRSHGDGRCIDIRPMRKGKAENFGLNYKSADYDRRKTEDFLKLLAKAGGTPILFNDNAIDEARSWPNHDNHIHVCFKKEDETVDKACENLQYDPKVCGELTTKEEGTPSA